MLAAASCMRSPTSSARTNSESPDCTERPPNHETLPANPWRVSAIVLSLRAARATLTVARQMLPLCPELRLSCRVVRKDLDFVVSRPTVSCLGIHPKRKCFRATSEMLPGRILVGAQDHAKNLGRSWKKNESVRIQCFKTRTSRHGR